MDIEAIKQANEAQTETPQVTLEGKDKDVEDYTSRRIREMQNYRESLGVEKKWREADVEYEPGTLDDERERGMHFETDEEQGLRTQLVPIGESEDEAWRSRNSDPTLMTKIQSAISIIIDQMPQAVPTAMSKKYEASTAIALAAWKRNWQITNAKEVYKLFVFDCAKYGWGVGRSYPRIIQYKKDILTEVDRENPENNKYESVNNVWFNDVAKQRLNPFRTWVDEQTKPYDDYTMNECYFELDFSYDAAKVEFGDYANFDKYVKPNVDLRHRTEQEQGLAVQDDEKKERSDIITIGFFESRLKDLYEIRLPKIKAPLYYGPLPNDDGMLSLWHTPWFLRSADHPYGISLWEMIKQKKTLYDKMQNMTMDQLVLSIMKMFFYTGTSSLIGDGKIKIEPGVGHQIVNGKVEFLNVPGPGKEAFEGLQFLKGGIDDDSAIPPVVEGQLTGKTLGEVLSAKEASLKKMKIPVENIADAMEQDAYITISWTSQIKSTPEIKEFATEQDIFAYTQEAGIDANQIFGQLDEETGNAVGPFKATFLPEMSLALEKNDQGKLVESKKEQFFQIGKDIQTRELYWRGSFKIVPKSIVSSSEELTKQGKSELFNLLVPLFPQPPQLFAKAAQQMIKVREEDPRDWLPDTWVQFLDGEKKSLFVPSAPPGVAPAEPGVPAAPGMGQGVPSNQTSMQGAAQTTPGGNTSPTVVPESQISTPTLPGINAAPRQELARSM